MGMVKIADLKNNLSRHLAHVRQGGQITVLDRETPIARIVPFVSGATAARRGGGADAGAAERMADLVRQGVLTPGDPKAAAAWLDSHEPLELPEGSRGAVDELIAMRRESTR